MNTNIYSVAFYFQGSYHYIKINANQIANKALSEIFGDSIYKLHDYNRNQYLYEEIEINDKKYLVDFSYHSSQLLNVYEMIDGDEFLVERDIPYLVLNVADGKEIIYKLSDYV